LMIGLDPSAAVHPGDNLHVFRHNVFLGLAVVVEVDSNMAACEFQPAGEDDPGPGDVVRSSGE
jgi:hypothetical protein